MTLRRLSIAALLLLFIAGCWYSYLFLSRTRTVAVLPLMNESHDPEADYLGKGLTASLVSQLSRLSGLRVKAPSLLPGASAGGLDVQKLGRGLKVDAVLVGKILKRDEGLVLQTSLVKSGDGSTVWTEEFLIEMAGIQTLHQQLAEKIVTTLEPWLGRLASPCRQFSSGRQSSQAGISSIHYITY